MKKFHKFFAFFLAASLLFCAACGSNADVQSPEAQPSPGLEPAPETVTPADIPQDNTGYAVGKTLPDFSFTTYDGKTMSLYEALGQKKMVLINLWATWCSPCGMEFPYMEEAYLQYKDKAEIFALSIEPGDSDEKLAEYAADMGMSFPVGRDEANLAAAFSVYSIPTSIIVDRFGTVCAVEAGAITSTEDFAKIFETYTAEDYSGSPSSEEENAAPVCDVAPSSPAELAAALNGENGKLAFANIDDSSVWPMTLGEKDGRSVAVSSNSGIAATSAVVSTAVSAEAGDALVITFALSCEDGCDSMRLLVNGQQVKCFNGEYGWTSYAYAFPEAGEYSIEIGYSKDSYGDAGEDRLWLDSVELLSGDAAQRAIAANPAYTFGEVTRLDITTPGAKEIIIEDPYGVLYPAESKELFSFYIVPGGEINAFMSLGSEYDPENHVLYCDYDFTAVSLPECMTSDGYSFSSGLDSMETTGYPYSTVSLVPLYGGSALSVAVCFSDEENVNSFLAEINASLEGLEPLEWEYADGSAPLSPTEVTYTVRYTDQNGDAVPGVTLQVCDESLCRVYVSDEDGRCVFTLPACEYELHTLMLPEGYEGDTDSLTYAPAEGGTLEFVLTKE